MSEKKIAVPEEMFKAMVRAENHPGYKWDEDVLRVMLEAALRWLSENPIVPRGEDLQSISTEAGRGPCYPENITLYVVEWQRLMFLSLEPEVPEEVKDLLLVDATTFKLADGREFPGAAADHNNAVIEAFRRGKAAR